jgi:ABC-type multidrug transport system ATPase subunit
MLVASCALRFASVLGKVGHDAKATEAAQVGIPIGAFKGVNAVAGIDLRVEPGESYGFLGPNGAGKSTTLKMLGTLLPCAA